MAHTFTAGEVTTAANLNSLLPPSSSQVGTVKITPVASTPTSITVTFTTPFASAPKVLASAYTVEIGDTVKGVAVTNVTTTGFTAWVYRTTTVGVTVSWQAWGPAPSAFVDGDYAYQSVLDSIGSAPMRVQVGQKSITPSAGSPTSGTVTFATPFASTPTVIISPDTNVVGSQVLGSAATNVTSTGFTAWVHRTNTTATGLNWIAMGRL